MKHPLHITSEIGELKTVLLHRPGKEVENLTPDSLERLLFDDIPFLPAIQKEHDEFAEKLRNRDIEVLYLEKLVSESLQQEEVRHQFIEQLLAESKARLNGSYDKVKEYLFSFSKEELVEKAMAGVLRSELEEVKADHSYENMDSKKLFFLDPMPNLYFTRDPAAVIGNGITMNRMNEGARRRESMFMEYIMNYHPRFREHDIPVWFNRDEDYSLEGGDELVLSREVVAIGISARTSEEAIKRLAAQMFQKQCHVEKVIAVEIPKCRAYMHLDTVFTMVHHDQFTIHPGILDHEGKMNIYILEQGKGEEGIVIQKRSNLEETLKEVLHLSEIDLIPCGGGDVIAAAREQWNDGSNTLAIAPGVVVTYNRNYVSNEVLRQHGIEVIEVSSSELSRGRGGPRCMSMPIVRKDLA